MKVYSQFCRLTGRGVRAAVLFACAVAVLVLSTAALAQADNPDAVLGKWVTQSGDAHVEVTKDGNVYTGKIVWLKDAVYPAEDAEAGKTVHDRENPDKALRDRPVVGLTILQGATYDKAGKYSGGKIYDPKEGKTYKCNITINGPDKLTLRGFIGVSLLGRNEEWTRLK